MGFQIKSPGLTCAASISNTFSTGRICLKLVEIFTSHTYRCFGIHRSSYWQVWSETIHFLTNWKFNDFGEQDRNICTGDKLHCQTRVKRCERIYFNPHHAWMWKLGVLSGLQHSRRRDITKCQIYKEAQRIYQKLHKVYIVSLNTTPLKIDWFYKEVWGNFSLPLHRAVAGWCGCFEHVVAVCCSAELFLIPV